MFEHRLPPLEILSEESLETLERGWMRLVSEIGIEFLHDGACDLFRAAGAARRGARSCSSIPTSCWSSCEGPEALHLHGAQPGAQRGVRAGSPVFTPAQSAPFVREGADRRDATFDDFVRMVRLTHVLDDLDTPGYPSATRPTWSSRRATSTCRWR